MKMAPIPFSEASNSNMNVFVKYGSFRIGVEHIEYFKAWKA
jgi:hypothetical protein